MEQNIFLKTNTKKSVNQKAATQRKFMNFMHSSQTYEEQKTLYQYQD